jgi:hypothetical protein
MFTGNTHAERRRLIEVFRRTYPVNAAGLSDAEVEAQALALADASTEALVSVLRQRGYTVALEVG